MTDDDLRSLLMFVCDRFVGYIPERRMLQFAIEDWRSETGHQYKGQEDGQANLDGRQPLAPAE